MSVNCAIFDFDGTLADSMHVWDDVGVKYMRSIGVEPREDFTETIAKMSLMESAAYAKKEYGLSQSEEEIIAGVNAIVADAYENEVQPKPGVKELIEGMYEEGISMVIATVSSEALVRAALQRWGMEQYFKDVITPERSHCGKESPVIYDMALKACGGTKKDTLVFEDAYHAAKTAKDAGYRVVHVFDESEKRQKDMFMICDAGINDFRYPEIIWDIIRRK